MRPGEPDRARVDDLPRARSSRSPSSPRPRATRRSWARRSRSSPRRTRPSTVKPGRRDRPDHHRRHGRAAPRHPRRPHAARVQGRGQRRQAAGRLPRDHPPQGREVRLHPQEADRWLGPVREGPGHASSRSTPSDGAIYEFENKVTGGRIPREYIPSVDAGIQDAMQYGVLAGYPLVGVKATLLDGAYHDVDSSEMAFKIAGSMVLKEAARKADPVILEPIMAVEVRTPEEYMGDVIGDLNSRRGQIQAMEDAAVRRSSRRTCRCRRCSATSATCGRRPRAGRSTPCSSTPTPRFRGTCRRDHREDPRRVTSAHRSRTTRAAPTQHL